MPGIVILTGGIGSGKSVVAGMLRERGIPVYDSDSAAKALYDSNPALVPALEEALGVRLRAEGGDGNCTTVPAPLDRRRLSSIIFNDPAAREKVEAIVYPLVLQDFLSWKERFPDAPFVVLESAVILSKMEYFPIEARVVLVVAPSAIRLQRTMSRDGSSAAAVATRMSAQPPIDPSLAHAVIDNSGTLSSLAAEVSRVFFPTHP